MVCRSKNLFIEGTRGDCKDALHLIEGIDSAALLTDRVYGTNAIVDATHLAGMEIVIRDHPPNCVNLRKGAK